MGLWVSHQTLHETFILRSIHPESWGQCWETKYPERWASGTGARVHRNPGTNFNFSYPVRPWTETEFGSRNKSPKLISIFLNTTMTAGASSSSMRIMSPGYKKFKDTEKKHALYWWAPLCPRVSLITQLVKNPPAMQETPVRFLGWEDPLQKGKTTHSSILAWRNPWTVQSTGLQRARHDSATFTFTLSPWRRPLWSLGSYSELYLRIQYVPYIRTFKFRTSRDINIRSISVSCDWHCGLSFISYCWWSFSSAISHLLSPPVSNSSCLFTRW